MGLRYRIPLPGPFYYLGRVGPRRRLPHSRHTGDGPIGFTVNRRFPVQRLLLQRLLLQRLAPSPAPRSHGFVPARQPVQPTPYGFVPAQRERVAVGCGLFGSDRCV